MTINRNLSLFAQGTFASGGVSIGNTTDPGAGNLSVTNNALIGTTTNGATNARLRTVQATSSNSALEATVNDAGYAGTLFYGTSARAASASFDFVGLYANGVLQHQLRGDGEAYFARNLSVTGTGKFGTTIGVGATTPSASGAGITFPATQSASTDVNTLDDYEEGTWTPSQGAGLTVVGAFSSSGTYTKVGRQVFLTGIVSGATSITAIGGAILCSAMPFNMGNVGTGSGANANANSGAVLVGVPGGSSLYSMSTITSSTSITFSVTYTV